MSAEPIVSSMSSRVPVTLVLSSGYSGNQMTHLVTQFGVIHKMQSCDFKVYIYLNQVKEPGLNK